jgi:hypothetical protein
VLLDNHARLDQLIGELPVTETYPDPGDPRKQVVNVIGTVRLHLRRLVTLDGTVDTVVQRRTTDIAITWQDRRDGLDVRSALELPTEAVRVLRALVTHVDDDGEPTDSWTDQVRELAGAADTAAATGPLPPQKPAA